MSRRRTTHARTIHAGAVVSSQAEPTIRSSNETSGSVNGSGVFGWNGIANDVRWEIHRGDAQAVLKGFSANRFSCVVTSPPYFWQRDYKVDGQIGKESSVDGYVKVIADTMDEVQRVLRDDGVLFLNLGDTYYSAKGEPKGRDPKNKARRFGLRAVDASGLGFPRKTAIGIPWRVALEMISRKWVLRAPIVWRREKCLPEPTARDRPWRTYEFVFLFSKMPRYYFDRKALAGVEDVWTISERPRSSNGVHSAGFPDSLVERCMAIGCRKGGEVLDPFAGSGTVLRVATRLGHPSVGIDISHDFCKYMADQFDIPARRQHVHLH
jgi:DNA modification methylase